MEVEVKDMQRRLATVAHALPLRSRALRMRGSRSMRLSKRQTVQLPEDCCDNCSAIVGLQDDIVGYCPGCTTTDVKYNCILDMISDRLLFRRAQSLDHQLTSVQYEDWIDTLVFQDPSCSSPRPQH